MGLNIPTSECIVIDDGMPKNGLRMPQEELLTEWQGQDT